MEDGVTCREENVELAGGRSAAGGSAQVSLITLTAAAGPEQQSRTEQTCLLLCHDTWKRPP